GFSVVAVSLKKKTNIFTYDADKRLVTARDTQEQRGDPSATPVFLSGSGGLLSTTDDYFRFAQMVLNGGEANGTRFLKASTVQLMRTNVLADGVAVDTYGPPQPGLG